MPTIFSTLKTTVFDEMSTLARETGAINLGQGFPDAPGPADVLQAAADALLTRSNQYPPSMGLPELRAAVADHYRAHQELDVAADGVMVTSGATEALAAAILGLIEAGDEVILIEPMYDAYAPLVRQAGGIVRTVAMEPPVWRLPIEQIAAVAGPNTRAILLNNPVNPVARRFDRGELEALAALCVERDLIAICDEVWEHIVFDGAAHVSLIGLDGMADRTVKIGSAGKIFGLTGWKVGFVIAAPDLLRPMARAHQFLTFTTPPNLQAAVAYGLAKPAAHFDAMRAELQRSRDLLRGLLVEGGFTVLPSEGTYFLCVDLDEIGESDKALARRIVDEAGVASIPLSAFYESDRAPRAVLRLCFAKADETLIAAAGRLNAWLAGVRSPAA